MSRRATYGQKPQRLVGGNIWVDEPGPPAALRPANLTYATLDFPGAAWTEVHGINRYGPLGRDVNIVGSYGDIRGTHGFLLSKGEYTTLDVPGKPHTEAWGINNRNQVVGYYYQLPPDSFDTAGFVYEAGTYTNIDVHEHCEIKYVYGIDDSGRIVGARRDPPHARLIAMAVVPSHDAPGGGIFPQQCFAWQAAPFDAVAYGISNVDYNDGYHIVGTLGGSPAVFSDRTGGSYGFTVPGKSHSIAYGINDSGQIVGVYREPIDEYIFRLFGFLDDQGTFSKIEYPGADYTLAMGINNRGFLASDGYCIVGTYYLLSEEAFSTRHGFLATLPPPASVSTDRVQQNQVVIPTEQDDTHRVSTSGSQTG